MNLKNKEITYMHDLGLFSSLGEAWVAVLRTIYQQGAAAAYTAKTKPKYTAF